MASNLLNLAGSLVSSFIFIGALIYYSKGKKKKSTPTPNSLVSICQALAGLTVSVKEGFYGIRELRIPLCWAGIFHCFCL